MKAISVRQPWANLIAQGKKTIETRRWKTSYRGDLVICASKSGSIPPRGCALCIVELYEIRPMEKKDERRAMCPIYPGAYSWMIRNVRQIPHYPVTGKLGIYETSLGGERGSLNKNRT